MGSYLNLESVHFSLRQSRLSSIVFFGLLKLSSANVFTLCCFAAESASWFNIVATRTLESVLFFHPFFVSPKLSTSCRLLTHVTRRTETVQKQQQIPTKTGGLFYIPYLTVFRPAQATMFLKASYDGATLIARFFILSFCL